MYLVRGRGIEDNQDSGLVHPGFTSSPVKLAIRVTCFNVAIDGDAEQGAQSPFKKRILTLD